MRVLNPHETRKALIMKRYGYARASSADQSTDIQEAALDAAGCIHVFKENRSGTSREGRDQLDLALNMVVASGSEGALVVTRVDRLARSMTDLQLISDALQAAGASLIVTEQKVDTSTAAGKAFFDMLGVFATFETNLRRERQMEGIAKAKAKGVYKGRPVSIDPAAIASLKAEGLGATAIAKRLGVGRASVYRLMADPTPVQAES